MTVFSFVACEDPNEGELFVQPSAFDYEKSMTTLLEEAPETYSLWIELLKHADFYNALKDANANATVFCPSNEAMTSFLQARGLSSVSELELEYAKRLVKNHIIDWGLNKNSLTDSTLIITARDENYIPAQNLFNQYLNLSYGYKKVDVDDEFRTDTKYSTDSIFFNNQARLGRFVSTTCSNGQLYLMDDVIIPNAENIVDKLEILDGENNTFKIFADAIKADPEMYKMATLERDTVIGEGGVPVVNRYYYTCFAVPDFVMKAAGITDVESLKAYLVNNNIEGDTDGAVALNKYLKYHFLPTQSTIKELFKQKDESETLIYDTSYKGQAFIANISGGKHILNKDIVVLRSDIEASNGLINKVSSVMPVYRPEPVVVRWDFLNSPDIISFVNSWSTDKQLGNIFTSELTRTPPELIDLSEEYKNGQYGTITSFVAKLAETKTKIYHRIGFQKESSYGMDMTRPLHDGYMNNYLVLNLGFSGWIEFTTPTIIAGKYKVVLHYIKDTALKPYFTTGTLTQFNLDGDSYQSLVYLYKGMTNPPVGSVEEQLWPVVEFEQSELHTFRITMRDIQAKTASNYHQRLDYVEFIPIN